MKLGRFAIGYGVLVIVVGLITAFARFALRVRAGEVAAAQAQLLGPLLDMLVFAPVFAAAVYYRRKPELHKRLMVVATTSLLIAAVGRMQFLGDPRIAVGASDLDGADPGRDGARLLAATQSSSRLRARPRRARARGAARPQRRRASRRRGRTSAAGSRPGWPSVLRRWLVVATALLAGAGGRSRFARGAARRGLRRRARFRAQHGGPRLRGIRPLCRRDSVFFSGSTPLRGREAVLAAGSRSSMARAHRSRGSRTRSRCSSRASSRCRRGP